jgi:hypothetical protein
MARQLDAHVRARRALAKRVVARRVEWGASDAALRAYTRAPGADWEERMMEVAYAAIALYSTMEPDEHGVMRSRWRETWGDKLSRYYVFGPPQRKIGTFKDVPADVVHGIMCKMNEALQALKLERAASFQTQD